MSCTLFWRLFLPDCSLACLFTCFPSRLTAYLSAWKPGCLTFCRVNGWRIEGEGKGMKGKWRTRKGGVSQRCGKERRGEGRKTQRKYERKEKGKARKGKIGKLGKEKNIYEKNAKEKKKKKENMKRKIYHNEMAKCVTKQGTRGEKKEMDKKKSKMKAVKICLEKKKQRKKKKCKEWSG